MKSLENRINETDPRDAAYGAGSPDLTKKEKLAFFRANAIRSKTDILSTVKAIREYYLSDRVQQDLPLEQLMTLLDRFYEEISRLHLMNLTEDWWQYEITVRETDITLSLVKTEVVYDSSWKKYGKSNPILLPMQVFPFYTTRARLLSPEDFGALYGVSGGTVRQWIRRGKLRSASKYGKEWRIPELSVVHSGERYSRGTYSWSMELPDVPEEFAFLNEYCAASVSSVRGERDQWEVLLSKRDSYEEKTLPLDSGAKERLEIYLLGEPLVECLNNCLGDFLTKSSQDWADMRRKDAREK